MQANRAGTEQQSPVLPVFTTPLARIIHDERRNPAHCHSERSEKSAFRPLPMRREKQIPRAARNDTNNVG